MSNLTLIAASEDFSQISIAGSLPALMLSAAQGNGIISLPGWTVNVAAQSSLLEILKPNPFNVVTTQKTYGAQAGYSLGNAYKIIVGEGDFSWFSSKDIHDSLVDGGVLPVVAFYKANSAGRTVDPPRLWSAITVSFGASTNQAWYGPGLEFYDSSVLRTTPSVAAAWVSAKLAKIFLNNPSYNIWDARQHLRQTASNYSLGWTENQGFGRPNETYASVTTLDVAPPVDISYVLSRINSVVTFTWRKFAATEVTNTVIKRQNGDTVYDGTATTFEWTADISGTEVFQFFHKNGSGVLSRVERCATVSISGLRNASVSTFTYIKGRVLTTGGEPRQFVSVLLVPTPASPFDPEYISRKPVQLFTNVDGFLVNSSSLSGGSPGGEGGGGIGGEGGGTIGGEGGSEDDPIAGVRGGTYRIQIDKSDTYKIRIPSDGGVHTLTSLIFE